MISIRGSMVELEKCHQDRLLAVDCYVAAIKNLANYTVELEPDFTESQKQYLNALASEAASGTREALCESQATLRGLLRDYRDRTAAYVRNLRSELEGTANALEQILSSMEQSDGDHEMRLRGAMGKLREVSRSPEGRAVGGVVLSAVDAIDQSLEQICKAHQLTVSQLQVEMGMLHKRIDTLEAAATLDRFTEFYNRREMEERIRAAAEPYTLLLVRASGLRLAEIQYKSEVAAQLTAAFTKRFRSTLPPSAIIARWASEDFVAMLFLTQPEVTAIAKTVGSQLSGSYACLLAGKTVRPGLQLSVAVVDSEGAPADRVIDRVKGFLVDS
jgi:GGDEF domain-containing protein